jgi:hypothetical protein
MGDAAQGQEQRGVRREEIEGEEQAMSSGTRAAQN